jgi:hypothetical protein
VDAPEIELDHDEKQSQTRALGHTFQTPSLAMIQLPGQEFVPAEAVKPACILTCMVECGRMYAFWSLENLSMLRYMSF